VHDDLGYGPYHNYDIRTYNAMPRLVATRRRSCFDRSRPCVTPAAQDGRKTPHRCRQESLKRGRNAISSWRRATHVAEDNGLELQCGSNRVGQFSSVTGDFTSGALGQAQRGRHHRSMPLDLAQLLEPRDPHLRRPLPIDLVANARPEEMVDHPGRTAIAPAQPDIPGRL